MLKNMAIFAGLAILSWSIKGADLAHQGCNAEYRLVDERLVGSKPKSFSDAEAAALLLTTITA